MMIAHNPSEINPSRTELWTTLLFAFHHHTDCDLNRGPVG